MKKCLFTFVGMAALLMMSLPSVALTLSFNPVTADVPVGSSVSVALVASNLNAPPALGGFDLDVISDPGLLNLTGITFGTALGNPDDFLETLTLTDASVAGLANLFAVSFLSDSALETLQSGDFTLATFDFTAISEGEGTLAISRALYSDTTGDIALSADLISGRITIKPATNDVGTVPEPSSALLLVAGLLGWKRASATRQFVDKQTNGSKE